MNNNLHTVLGSNGAVGKAVVEELKRRNLHVRMVTKSKPIFGSEVLQADITKLEDTQRVLNGSSYVYMCVGLQYSEKVWARDWPVIVNNLVKVCSEQNAKIIFLDNTYMYGPIPLQTPIDEKHSQKPTSKKGLIRKNISEMLLNAHKEKKVQVVIGRSADFFGAYATNSPLYISFLERLLEGKNPQSLSSLDVKHTYANVSDNGRALVNLALDDSTFGEVWHLPTSSPVTYHEVNEKFNSYLGTKLEIIKVSRLLVKFLSLVIPPIKEVSEMLYQFEQMYILDSKKFMKKFPSFEVTSIDQGLIQMVDSLSK